MSLRYAYNTNGLQSHRLPDALELLAEAGYDGVALTLDVHHHDPLAPDLPGRTAVLRDELADLGLGAVVETGARFLLDPRRKHAPSLVSGEADGRARRLAVLDAAVEVAAGLGAEAVSFWAGIAPRGQEPARTHALLVEGCAALAARAADRGVVVALEPEPGMAVETVDGYRRLAADVPGLRLALDVGHCLVTGDRDPAAAVRETAGELGTVAIEDMARGIHEHLPFGEGDLDLPAVLAALDEIRFEGLVCVELSRDSHRAHTMVGDALAALRAARPVPRSGAGQVWASTPSSSRRTTSASGSVP